MHTSASSLTVRRLSCKIVTAALALTMSVNAFAGTLFSDGFESGALSLIANTIQWIDPTRTEVSTDRAYSGSHSLKFTFIGGASGTDAWAEQRMSLPQKTDYWFRYKLYIPSNYVHRTDGASNNKFLAVYRAPYTSPGFQVNFSLEPNGSGGSNMEIHHYNNGVEQSVRQVATNFIADADKGKWMDLVVEVKVPTSSTSSDGVMRLWKNGTQVVNVTNLPSWGGTGANYIDEIYFLGWANSGFTETTYLYIDDVQVSDSAISVTTATPNAPSSISVQ